MIDFASLPMALKTTLTTLLFLTLCAGVYAALVIGGKQGKGKLCLMTALTLTVGAMMLLYASLIPAERAKPEIPAVSLWLARQPVVFTTLVWLAIAAFLAMVILEEFRRRSSVISDSAIKESLDHLQMGVCFSHPNGLVVLTNYRMNELTHAITGKPLQNANLFWEALCTAEPLPGVERMSGGDKPEFRLPDGTVWSFRREELEGVNQICAAETTMQHQLINELHVQRMELENMNARIADYGEKVDEYVIARERLETRVNLHSFLGQALLMTRHYLKYHMGDRDKIMNTWQRNIDVLRMEAEPQPEPDSFSSLRNAAQAIGIQVHVRGKLPTAGHVRKLAAAIGAETLTNAVRHAGAKQLWIDIEETDADYLIRYTNDGAPPGGAVTEGGGLSTARRKVEAAGGRMSVAAAPRYELTLAFAKEAKTDV